MPWLDLEALDHRLGLVCDHYERSAPTVHAWADGLGRRVDKAPDTARLAELLALAYLCDADGWMNPNHAANYVYKLQHRLGQDTTGHAGF